MGMSPTFFSLPDVDQSGLADGDLFRYDAASGQMVVIAQSALQGNFQYTNYTGSAGVAAGATSEFNLAPTTNYQNAILFGVAIKQISVAPAGTPIDWELGWVNDLGYGGVFRAPNVTVLTTVLPASLPGAGIVRVRLRNNAAGLVTYVYSFMVAQGPTNV